MKLLSRQPISRAQLMPPIKLANVCNLIGRRLILAFGFFVLVACTSQKPSDTRLGVVEKGDVLQKISLNGTLRGVRGSKVQPGYSGYVGKIFVKVGDKVKAGQALVKVTQTLDQPLSEVFPIKAPFAGTITQILARQGDYLTTTGSGDTNSTILMLDDISEIWVDASVPEVDVSKLKIGMTTSLRANALPGKVFQGKVMTLALSPRQSTNRWDRGKVEYPTEIKIENPDQDLVPGMTVVVDVITAEAKNIVTVKHEFVQRDDEGFFLETESGDVVRIKTGLANEERVEVKSGAEPGLKVKMMDFSRL